MNQSIADYQLLFKTKTRWENPFSQRDMLALTPLWPALLLLA